MKVYLIAILITSIFLSTTIADEKLPEDVKDILEWVASNNIRRVSYVNYFSDAAESASFKMLMETKGEIFEKRFSSLPVPAKRHANVAGFLIAEYAAFAIFPDRESLAKGIADPGRVEMMAFDTDNGKKNIYIASTKEELYIFLPKEDFFSIDFIGRDLLSEHRIFEATQIYSFHLKENVTLYVVFSDDGKMLVSESERRIQQAIETKLGLNDLFSDEKQFKAMLGLTENVGQEWYFVDYTVQKKAQLHFANRYNMDTKGIATIESAVSKAATAMMSNTYFGDDWISITIEAYASDEIAEEAYKLKLGYHNEILRKIQETPQKFNDFLIGHTQNRKLHVKDNIITDREVRTRKMMEVQFGK